MLKLVSTLVLVLFGIAARSETCLEYLDAHERDLNLSFTTIKRQTVRLSNFQKVTLCQYTTNPAKAVDCMTKIEGELKKQTFQFRKIDGKVSKPVAVMDQFEDDRVTAFAALCSGNTNIQAAANCVAEALNTVGMINDTRVRNMTGWGVGTACGNNNRAVFVNSCLESSINNLLLDGRSKGDFQQSYTADLCANGPTKSGADAVAIEERMACMNPNRPIPAGGLDGGTAETSRRGLTASTNSITCPGSQDAKGGIASVPIFESGIPSASKVYLCASGGKDYCCPYRLLRDPLYKMTINLAKFSPEESEKYEWSQRAAGIACSHSDSNYDWARIRQCLTSPNKDRFKTVSPDDPQRADLVTKSIICGNSSQFPGLADSGTGTK